MFVLFSVITLFQWGNDLCYDNNIDEGRFCDIVGPAVVSQINSLGSVNGNTVGPYSQIRDDNTMAAGSTIRYNVLLSPSSIYSNTLDEGAIMHLNNLTGGANISVNIMAAGAVITANNVDAGIDLEGTIRGNTVGIGCYIANNM